MPYNSAGLKQIANGANNPWGTAPGNVAKMFHYSTADAIATVVAADYFLSEITRLAVGDVLFCSCGSGATLTTVVVATNTGTVITTVKTA